VALGRVEAGGQGIALPPLSARSISPP
jgi:hypothetical protein